ncbi:MAG TPA: 4-(cytidine 5'-diphospho)-2-C-methyl-D-erythritol kinase [Candidatus Hydrogenedens sp.]|nr:4-(cytidine 5'-diphospho)-2-C-methyl-D-erythritol kinase [Candidatus Hydrogenedens sp.]
MAKLKIVNNAKINLYLDVIGKFPDGYHKIESIFQTVNLTDTLIFKEIPKGIQVITNNPFLPTDERNIIYKTIEMVKKRTNIKTGIQVQLQKNIPICAGLGGGSGNSAGTLSALNSLWNLGWDELQLRNIAERLGSDVPYFVTGGTQAVTGKGEILHPLPNINDQWLVLIHPDIPLSTAKVYQHPALSFRTHLDKNKKFTLPFIKAIVKLQKREWEHVIYNRLEVPAFKIAPQLECIKTKIKKWGYPYVGMSGSGSTFFVLVESKEQGEKLIEKVKLKANLVKTEPFGIKIN